MIVDFSPEERQTLETLEKQFEASFSVAENKLAELRPENKPDTLALFEGLSPKKTPAKWNAALQRESEILEEWEASGSEAWRQARAELWKLVDDFNEARRKLYLSAEMRFFEKLAGDPQRIVDDARGQIGAVFLNVLEARRDPETQNNALADARACVYGSLRHASIDASGMRRLLRQHLQPHYRALENDKARTEELDGQIISLLEKSALFSGELLKDAAAPPPLAGMPLGPIRTRYPKKYITPVDKVSNLAFTGSLNAAKLQQIAMEHKGSSRLITTLVSIDFEGLKDDIKIQGRRELTAYDREVHDAIITLFVDGGNEYITPQMIYQTMTGNPNTYLNPKQANAIHESITKCLYSRVIIDADEEARAYGFDSFRYDGALISGERVTALLNGVKLECLHLLRKPVLYDYAEKKKQIGRFDIKLLNSPINKNEESITLQGYLYRRILSMKANENLSRSIVYDTIYNQVGLESAERKKKLGIRKKTKDILTFWTDEKFIAGFGEVSRKNEVYSLTIDLETI